MTRTAVAVNPGDVLTITAGVTAYDSNGNLTQVSSGSWFAFDFNGNGNISGTEKNALCQGTTGLVIGVTTVARCQSSRTARPGDTNEITAPWLWFGKTGSDYLTIPVTGDTITGLDMSGWTVAVMAPRSTWAAGHGGQASATASAGSCGMAWTAMPIPLIIMRRCRLATPVGSGVNPMPCTWKAASWERPNQCARPYQNPPLTP